MNKKEAKQKRSKRTRMSIRKRGDKNRLSIHKTPKHMYAQVTTADGSKTLASASTLDKELRSALKATGNSDAAKAVGKLIAERAKKAGVETVAFDRSGFIYHGRVAALADAAREGGLEF